MNDGERDENAGLEYAKKVVAEKVNPENRFENILKTVEVISGGEGKIVCRYKVPTTLANSHGTLHGGIIAGLIDAVSTWALSTAVKHNKHMSMDLSVSFMRKIPLGDTVTIEGKVVKVGARVAYLTATVTDKDGKVLATGKHSKLMMANKL